MRRRRRRQATAAAAAEEAKLGKLGCRRKRLDLRELCLGELCLPPWLADVVRYVPLLSEGTALCLSFSLGNLPSREQNGSPATSLKKHNFRLAVPLASKHKTWFDTDLAGFYYDTNY